MPRAGLGAEARSVDRRLVPVYVFVEPLGGLAQDRVTGIQFRRFLAFRQCAGEVALPFEHHAQYKVGLGQVRLQADRFAFFSARLHIIAGAPICQPQLTVSYGILGPQADHRPLLGHGVIPIVLMDQRQPQVEVRVRILRAQADRLLQFRDCTAP